MTPQLSRAELERRRLEAVQVLQRVPAGSRVALHNSLGVSRSTIFRWRRELQEGGVDALKRRRAPGRPRRVNRNQVRAIWERGPEPYGEKRWTTRLLAAAIEKETGVRYDADHAGRIAVKLGLRPKRRRAVSRVKTQGGSPLARGTGAASSFLNLEGEAYD